MAGREESVASGVERSHAPGGLQGGLGENTGGLTGAGNGKY